MAIADDIRDPQSVGSVANPAPTARTQQLGRRESACDLLAVGIWVAASDWLLYRSGAYAAWAAFFVVAAMSLIVAKRSLGSKWLSLTVMSLLLACCIRLAWCGSWLAVASGIGLLACFAMTLNGTPPYLPDVGRFLMHAIWGSGSRVSRLRWRSMPSESMVVESSARWLLPAIVVILFSTIFVRANPDLWKWAGGQIAAVADQIGSFLSGLDPMELSFWILSGLLALGLAHPAANYLLPSPVPSATATERYIGYKAIRNSLVCVIVLFAVYLVFEFMTLWFRELPEGFYYAGYAHEGAAWLTVALALATLVLSLFFRVSAEPEARIERLRWLAWIWSAENFLLALAVYHRMAIYIDFNGMTRMRIVGLFGITAVVIGFACVIVKILHKRNILWLLRYQLWTVACAVVLYAVLPVDYFVHRFNVRQILAGNLAPTAQIPTHETSAEGMLPLILLVDSEDAIIRDGIRATLADWYARTDSSAHLQQDWRNRQAAHYELRYRLEQMRASWQPYLEDSTNRKLALQRFYDYAYQWY